MTKRQLIDQIITVNRSAQPGFLARFDDEDLRDYLDHLMAVRQPRLAGETHRYEKYFTAPQAATATAVLEAPEQEDQDDLRPDDADETPSQRDALVPAFIYDQQYSPTVDDTHGATDDDEEQQAYDDQDPGQDGDYLTEDPSDRQHDDIIAEDDAVGVRQFADASFADAETDEDMESWLF